jgi:hypothetical protein
MEKQSVGTGTGNQLQDQSNFMMFVKKGIKENIMVTFLSYLNPRGQSF